MSSQVVRERDFRQPEFLDADPADYEFRGDGKIVRKDRWESAVVSIRHIVGIDGREFEIDDVIGRVRSMAEMLTKAPLQSIQFEILMVLKSALAEIERNTCLHEETHRGGAIWEICDACGAQWADDKGGKPPHEDKKIITELYAAIEKLEQPKT